MLKLIYYGHPTLRKKAKVIDPINKEIKELAAHLKEGVIKYDGVGLAAPQVNHSVRMFVTRVPVQQENEEWADGPIVVYINPILSEPSQETWNREEGCLSVPGLYVPVERPLGITIEATDLEGNTFKKEAYGLEARVIMHENDHLNGVLHIDRMHSEERKKIDYILREIKKKYKDQ